MLAQLGSLNETTSRIIKAAVEVHRTLGPGLLETVYTTCILYELRLANLKVEINKPVPVVYKGIPMDVAYRLDLRVDDKVVVEVKAVETILAVHEAQLMTYLKLTHSPVGLLLNFDVPLMKDGIRRLLNRAALKEQS
jgi:GxxExxY protein